MIDPKEADVLEKAKTLAKGMKEQESKWNAKVTILMDWDNSLFLIYHKEEQSFKVCLEGFNESEGSNVTEETAIDLLCAAQRNGFV